MKKIIDNLTWIFDYYFAPFLYNERKFHVYDKYMKNKYGEKYKSRI